MGGAGYSRQGKAVRLPRSAGEARIGVQLEVTVKHSELRRLAALDAMGIQAYVSREQLPGAAVTRRLAIVRSAPSAAPLQRVPATSAGALPTPSTVGAPPITRLPQIEAPAPAPEPARRPAAATVHSAAPLRFSLAAVVAGGWLWLEEIDHSGMRSEQLQLVQGMVRALATAGSGIYRDGQSPLQEVEYFRWPLHQNRQLDQGEEAARHGVAGFVQRRLEVHQCSAMVLMGEDCRSRVPLQLLDCPRVLVVPSTANMLASPLAKKQAWRELRSVCPVA